MNGDQPIDIELLITRHLDGELSAEGLSALQSWLRADPANADLFARRAIDHQRLHELTAVQTLVLVSDDLDGDPLPNASQMQAVDGDMLSALAALGQGQDEARPVDITRQVKRLEMQKRIEAGRISRLAAMAHEGSREAWTIPAAAIWLGLAATVGLVAWLGWGLTDTNTVDTPTPLLGDDNASPADRTGHGPVVAMITESVDAHWVDTLQTDGLRAGATLTLAAGFAQVRFSDYGSVLVEGPATFEVIDSSTLRLIEGRVVAQATRAPSALSLRVGDTVLHGRNTEFGVACFGQNQASAIVYSGSIGVSQVAAGPQAHADRIVAGRAARLAPQLGTVVHESVLSPSDTADFSRSIDGVRLRPFEHTDTVHFLADLPSSLCIGDLVDSRRVRLILESRSTVVDSDVVLAVGRVIAPTLGTFPLGQRVDSYLLHMDPLGGVEEGSVVLSGSITFERPIQAVMGGPRDLAMSDRLFGSELTTYPRFSRTAGGPSGDLTWGIETNDSISLSEDRQTLHFRLRAGASLDQLRILVLSDELN